jgi:hypothetical protein
MIYVSLEPIPKDFIKTNDNYVLIYNDIDENCLKYKTFQDKETLYQSYYEKIHQGYCIIIHGQDDFAKLMTFDSNKIHTECINSIFILPSIYQGMENYNLSDILRITALQNVFTKQYVENIIRNNVIFQTEGILQNVSYELCKSVLLPNKTIKDVRYAGFILSYELKNIETYGELRFSSVSATDIKDLELYNFFNYMLDKSNDTFIFGDTNTLIIHKKNIMNQGYLIL